ncbi:PHP domain-containing protein [Salipaludibacillus sp. LMS25]|jgi:hypothetical protein|uniref:PHP-associated domain-containing protein n=1 Tax=Salipaludibacillus sp. LMS25 TaxID=2924031 RepID=UPI0020D0F82F|nr:PHP-associated domain-containing protein [Salipaludibacillus sp. LMS25]UTR14927.1 PHP domain-containing protein [Salipaludibacillus sp. LMS25]
MNIDLHTHMKLSKKTYFDEVYFNTMVAEALANDLNAIALTEHFNTLRFSDIYDSLDKHFPYESQHYNAHGLKIFPGLEVDIAETGHILLIGARESVRAIRRHLEPFTEPDHFVPFKQLLDWADELNMIKIGAHPYRDSTPLHHLDKGLLSRLDAFDLNGKDLYVQGQDQLIQDVSRLADELSLPIVGGSDTHHFLQYGSVYSTFPAPIATMTDLKSAIKDSNQQVHISPCLKTKVKSAILMKKMLKSSVRV